MPVDGSITTCSGLGELPDNHGRFYDPFNGTWMQPGNAGPGNEAGAYGYTAASPTCNGPSKYIWRVYTAPSHISLLSRDAMLLPAPKRVDINLVASIDPVPLDTCYEGIAYRISCNGVPIRVGGELEGNPGWRHLQSASAYQNASGFSLVNITLPYDEFPSGGVCRIEFASEYISSDADPTAMLKVLPDKILINLNVKLQSWEASEDPAYWVP